MDNDVATRVIYDMLDTSDRPKLLVNLDNFQVLYANENAKSIFGERIENIPCYDAINLRNLPCPNCPVLQLKCNESKIMQVYMEAFDTHVNLQISKISWVHNECVGIYTIMNPDTLLEKKMRKEIEADSVYKEKLRLSGELYSAVVEQMETIVFEYNYAENKAHASPLLQERFGIEGITDIDFTKDKKTKQIIHTEDISIYHMLFHGRNDDFREVTCRLIEQTGRLVWYRICLQFIRDEKGNLTRAIGTLRDVDEVTKSYEALKRRAEYDVLTEIPNAIRYYIDAERLLADNEGRQYAIVVFDVNKFKMINDLFGMIKGDETLKHIAKALAEKLPEDALFCRMHSDVFSFCMEYIQKGDIIKQIERIRKGIYNNEFSFDINTSFGIYLADDYRIPVNLMCDRAALASKTVKGNAMKFCAFYNEQYRNEIVHDQEIEQDMNVAIDHKQFVMYLQPKYSLQTGKILGAEVLARWNHPTKGLIQPMDFIPLFERNGFILKLDEYMWEEACKTLATWKKEGKKQVPLSVNISRYHLKHNNLVKTWERLIEKYDISTKLITLEITETLFFDKEEELYHILLQLQEKGFQLEVDDFGTGYSSLNMLRHIPVDTIKIDKGFLDQKMSTEKGKIVISHTIAMAKDLKLNVIAEGVETEEHVQFLKETECDVAQGYFFAKPMPLEQFNTML